MFRLSKITDYGIVILAHFARVDADGPAHSERRDEEFHTPSLNARELAEQVDLPVPIVSKVLKALTRAGVLESQRGAKGGYSLVRRPEELSVSEMIAALDGPLALTQCNLGPSVCDIEQSCAIRSPWLVINQVVQYTLSSVTLADLTNPDFTAQYAPLTALGLDALPLPMSERTTGKTHEEAQ
jgi:FeS assembly SUF system regulator